MLSAASRLRKINCGVVRNMCFLFTYIVAYMGAWWCSGYHGCLVLPGLGAQIPLSEKQRNDWMLKLADS